MNMILNRIALTFAMVLSGGVWAAQTDISSAPLTSTTTALVKPNIMLLMDTSGSMGWSHMPDEVASGSGIEAGITRIGYKAAQCNVLYYNRNLTYAVPKKPDGTPFPTPSFTNAPYAGYLSYYASPSAADLTSVNLSNSFKAYDDYTLGTSGFNDTPKAAYYYWYEGTQSLKYNAAPCTDTDNMTGTTDRMATGGGTWHRVVVSTTSGPADRADELNNFAIWYSYYRIRISLTKSAASLAFTPLTDSTRVGFITVRPKDNAADTAINQAKYLAINDFNSSQRDLWFAKLFSQTPQGSSPAREGLARVGRHYAGKTDGINTGMTGDPMQFSCQQNFTIMTTDGYWNSQEESPNGGPVGLDGVTPVGQVDGTLTDDAGLTPRPLWDNSATSTAVQVDASNLYSWENCSGTAQLQTTFQQLSSTKQYTSSTVQTSQTTDQFATRTRQFLQSTDQYTTSTVQTSKTTQQYLSSTIQYRQSTQQYTAYTTQTSKRTQQYTTATRQNLQTTDRYTKSTSQTSKTTQQYTLATNQPLQSTYKLTQSVVQYTRGTAQVSRRDYRNIAFDARTELRTPVKTCTPSTYISCEILEVAPLSPAASCTAGQALGPDFTVTVCSNTGTPVAPVASCTPGITSSGAPNYVTTTCTQTTTTPAADVASCTLGTTTGAAPNYYVTTCTKTVLSTDVKVASCSPGTSAANVITTCSADTTPATGVETCTVGSTTDANGKKSTCVFNNTTVKVAASPACTNQTAGTGNSWIGISCNTVNTPETNFNGTCTAGTTNDASFLYTTCKKYPLTANVGILATCVAGRGPAPDYITTTCPAPVVTAPVGVSSCTPGTTVSGTFVQTTCTYTDNSGFVANVAACPASTAANGGNGWTTTTCNTVTSPTTVVPSCVVGTTTTGSPNYINTVCTLTNLTTNTPVAACTPGTGPAPGYVLTTCPAPVVTAPVGVLTCVPGTTQIATPPYTVTTCTYSNSTVYVPDSSAASCTNQTGASGNQYITVSCNTVTTPASPSATQCTPGTITSGAPNYLRTTCAKNVLTSNVPVASCTEATGGAPNYIVTTCPTPVTSPWQGVASCTPGNTPGVGPSYVGSQCVHNNTTVYVPTVASCTPQTAGSGNSYVGITCNTVSTPATNVASCTPGTTTGANFLNTTCTEVPGTGQTPVATCTPGTGAGPAFVTTSCTTNPLTSNVAVANCTPSNGTSPDYVHTTCSTGPAPGKKRMFKTSYTTTTTNYSGGFVIGTPLVELDTPAGSALQETDNVCYITGVSSPPALPVPNPTRPGPTELPAPLAGCTAWPCSNTTARDVGSRNSLADVAQYYYITDLRPAADWPNEGVGKVPSVGSGPEDDRVNWQHMTTFTIALGVSGTLNYQSDYRSSAATTGDFADIRAGRNGKAWPVWPDPLLTYTNDFRLWENPKSIDDFWHTAVNGRGQYFSAGDPTSVVAGLKGALAGIEARLASATGVGSSTQQPVIGDNAAFVATFFTQDWYGDVQSRPIDLATGALQATVTWSAQAKLDATTGNLCDNRQIKLLRASALVDFTMDTKTCDSSGLPTGAGTTALTTTEQAYFNSTVVQQLSQWLAMTDGTFGKPDQVTPSAGANLVNFIRGQRGFEGFETGSVNKLYRARKHVLGDVATSQPLYVKQPFAAYADSGYEGFKTAQAGRKPMVYVGANDGMLHAFYAGASASDPDAGKEAWAVIPSAVLPNLFKLADDNYKNTHQFFVDGSPVAGDAFDTNSNQWKTVLVGGLNAGGKSYYAMDVTNPDSPQGLWEFKWSDTCYDGSAATAGADCHLGYTFGKPVITKLANGTWVVLLTSGYNNVNAPSKTGDGVGYLYVLNAFTGKVIYKISTNAGSAGTPSGLAQINNYVDNAVVNNTTLKVYGGDVLGNIWRFDVNDTIAPSGREATKIGVAETAGHAVQPITTRPELAELNGKPMVFVGTGRLLGATDVKDASVQSVYGIVDPSVGDPVYADLRASLKPLTLTQVGKVPDATRTIACTGTTAQCGSTSGWVVDLPASGERVNIDMKLVLGTLVFASNVPDDSACTTGGYSWLNYLDFATGTAVIGGTSGSVGVYRDGSLAVGLGVWRLPTGGGSGTDPGKFVGTVSGSDGSTTTTPVPVKSPVPDGKRISWREIAQ